MTAIVIQMNQTAFRFEWDKDKALENRLKHRVAFDLAVRVFEDRDRIISKDWTHSHEEDRFLCVGLVDNKIITVRFTYRGDSIRIFGAGLWRKGRKFYERENKIHR